MVKKKLRKILIFGVLVVMVFGLMACGNNSDNNNCNDNSKINFKIVTGATSIHTLFVNDLEKIVYSQEEWWDHYVFNNFPNIPKEEREEFLVAHPILAQFDEQYFVDNALILYLSSSGWGVKGIKEIKIGRYESELVVHMYAGLGRGMFGPESKYFSTSALIPAIGAIVVLSVKKTDITNIDNLRFEIIFDTSNTV